MTKLNARRESVVDGAKWRTGLKARSYRIGFAVASLLVFIETVGAARKWG